MTTTTPDTFASMTEAIRLMGQRAEARGALAGPTHGPTARAIVEAASDRWIRHRDHDGALHAAREALRVASIVVDRAARPTTIAGLAADRPGRNAGRDAASVASMKAWDRVIRWSGPDAAPADREADVAHTLASARGAYRPTL